MPTPTRHKFRENRDCITVHITPTDNLSSLLLVSAADRAIWDFTADICGGRRLRPTASFIEYDIKQQVSKPCNCTTVTLDTASLILPASKVSLILCAWTCGHKPYTTLTTSQVSRLGQRVSYYEKVSKQVNTLARKSHMPHTWTWQKLFRKAFWRFLSTRTGESRWALPRIFSCKWFLRSLAFTAHSVSEYWSLMACAITLFDNAIKSNKYNQLKFGWTHSLCSCVNSHVIFADRWRFRSTRKWQINARDAPFANAYTKPVNVFTNPSANSKPQMGQLSLTPRGR